MWSRPDIWNSVRKYSRRMKNSNDGHIKVLNTVIKYCVDIKIRGWTLRPNSKWNGRNKNIEIAIDRDADSNYAIYPDTRKSIT